MCQTSLTWLCNCHFLSMWLKSADKSYTCPAFQLVQTACVGASPQQLFMNTIIFFCSCWNDGSHCVTTSSVLPKNLAARICGVSEPKKTGCVSCAACKKKEQMLELPPLMTNMQIQRERERRAPKTATFPASFPRGGPEGKGYSLAVDDGELIEWKGEEINLPLPVCQCCCLCLCLGTLYGCLDSWRVLCFPSPVYLNISVHNTALDCNGMRNWAWQTEHCVVYLCCCCDQYLKRKNREDLSWCGGLRISCFLWPTVQNLKIFNLKLYETDKYKCRMKCNCLEWMWKVSHR